MALVKPIILNPNGSTSTIASGDTIPVANLATGTPNGTKFIRDDGVLATPPSGINSLTIIGLTPNVNGATITGNILNLQPADATFGGILTAIAQTFNGFKTFLNDIIVNGSYFGTRGVATNLWVGPSAGLTSTATSSVGIGNYALSLSSGINSTGVGSGSLYANTGANSTAMGESSLANNTGSRSTGVGKDAGSGNTGADLTTFGNSSAISNTAAQVTALGIAAAIGNTQPNGIHIGTGLMVTTANAPNQIIFAPGGLQQRHSLGNYTANRDIAWKDGSGTVAFTNDLNILPSYTVATLPTGVLGMTAFVSDATAPTYLGTLTGGGAVKCPVFFNGVSWVSS